MQGRPLGAASGQDELRKWRQLLLQLQARLEAHRRLASEPPPPGTDPPGARRLLDRILAGDEFAWQQPTPSWLHRVLDRLRDWLERLISGFLGTGAADQLLVLLAAAAVLVVLASVLAALREHPPAAGAIRAGKQDGSREDRSGKRKDLGRLAEEARREGRFREALRLLYLAFLDELHHARLISLVRHKTNWDYRREIQPNREELGRIFGAFTELYEAKWYGREDCTADHYELAGRLADEARGVIR